MAEKEEKIDDPSGKKPLLQTLVQPPKPSAPILTTVTAPILAIPEVKPQVKSPQKATSPAPVLAPLPLPASLQPASQGPLQAPPRSPVQVTLARSPIHALPASAVQIQSLAQARPQTPVLSPASVQNLLQVPVSQIPLQTVAACTTTALVTTTAALAVSASTGLTTITLPRHLQIQPHPVTLALQRPLNQPIVTIAGPAHTLAQQPIPRAQALAQPVGTQAGGHVLAQPVGVVSRTQTLTQPMVTVTAAQTLGQPLGTVVRTQTIAHPTVTITGAQPLNQPMGAIARPQTLTHPVVSIAGTQVFTQPVMSVVARPGMQPLGQPVMSVSGTHTLTHPVVSISGAQTLNQPIVTLTAAPQTSQPVVSLSGVQPRQTLFAQAPRATLIARPQNVMQAGGPGGAATTQFLAQVGLPRQQQRPNLPPNITVTHPVIHAAQAQILQKAIVQAAPTTQVVQTGGGAPQQPQLIKTSVGGQQVTLQKAIQPPRILGPQQVQQLIQTSAGQKTLLPSAIVQQAAVMKTNPQLVQTSTGPQTIVPVTSSTVGQPLIQTTIVHQPSGVQTQIIQQPPGGGPQGGQPQQAQMTQSLSSAPPISHHVFTKPVTSQVPIQALLRTGGGSQVVTIPQQVQLQQFSPSVTAVKHPVTQAQKLQSLPQLQPQPIQLQLQLAKPTIQLQQPAPPPPPPPPLQQHQPQQVQVQIQQQQQQPQLQSQPLSPQIQVQQPPPQPQAQVQLQIQPQQPSQEPSQQQPQQQQQQQQQQQPQSQTQPQQAQLQPQQPQPSPKETVSSAESLQSESKEDLSEVPLSEVDEWEEEEEREPISSIDLAIMKNLLYAQAPIERKKPEVTAPPAADEPEVDVTATPFETQEFTWEEYLEVTGAMAVPHSAFKHVESSLESPFVAGMKLEVVNRNISPGHSKTYWVATVVATCGQLLLLRYDGYDLDRSADFWCDVTSGDLHPIGWCAQHSQQLSPPESIRDRCDNWSEFLVQDLTGAITAPVFLLEGDAGKCPAEQIKPGMRMEVTNELNPLEVWLAVVRENYGGRLLLRLEGGSTDAFDFWLFYQSHRVHPLGWAKDKGYSLKPFAELMAGTPFSAPEWTYIHHKGVLAASKTPLPKSFFRNQQSTAEHYFRVGMKLEAINPKAPSQICPATIVKVFNNQYFLVEIDDLAANKTPVQIVGYGGCGGLFPMGWCKEHVIQLTPPNGYDCTKFDWGEYLKHCNAVEASRGLFRTYCVHEFQRGMKLEAVNPFNAQQICAATVTKIIGRHMWLHFDGWKLPNHIVDVESHDIFPVGWCESTGFPLKPPKKIPVLVKKTKKVAVVWPEKQISNKSTPLSPGRDLYQKMREGPPRGDESGEEANKTSHWSPKIYFNHKCFSGPYLNKGRIAELPRAVGPGIVTLVLKEVISLLINAAYKPPRVLRELQVEHEETAGMNGHLQVMKAKYKGKSYRAMVEICKAADEVDKFCRDMCIKLECCPNLVSVQQVEENCVENCSTLTKTKYTHYYGKKKRSRIGRPPGGHSNLEHGPKKPGKRRKRRKPFVHRKKRTSSNEEAGDRKENENDEDDEDEEEEEEDEEIENGEEENSGEEKIKRKRQYRKDKEKKVDVKVGIKRPLIMTRAKALLESAKRAKIPKLVLPDRERGKKMVTRYGALASGTSHHHHHHHHHHHPSHHRHHRHGHRHMDASPSATQRKTTETKDKNAEEVLQLATNPLYWSVAEVVDFIKATDCAPLAKIFKDQEIDGQALLLLTLPTVQECMELKLGPAIKLCHHIERVKIAFYEQYAK